MKGGRECSGAEAMACVGVMAGLVRVGHDLLQDRQRACGQVAKAR